MESAIFYSDLQGGSEYIYVLYTYLVNTLFRCPNRDEHPWVSSYYARLLLSCREGLVLVVLVLLVVLVPLKAASTLLGAAAGGARGNSQGMFWHRL